MPQHESGESMLGQNALSVSELNEYVRRLISGDVLLRSLEVCGEISGYKHHISGHRYFTLKDANARVQCVMFRQNAYNLAFEPKDGMQVKLRAQASLFPRDGSFQLYVSSIEKRGVGDLYRRFEELKEKLAREGLFDPAIKRELPYFPKCIGIATSQTGAALRDMVRIARRRNPNVGIIFAPCSVQGAGAAEEIVRAIELLNRDGRAEVLLVGRGGGSIEDLWAFNEEIVARTIAASKIPIISCVGHETDFSISDFVADVRAATPSMASEIAVPLAEDLKKRISESALRLKNALAQGNRIRKSELMRVCASASFENPRRYLIDERKHMLSVQIERLQTAQKKYRTEVQTKLDKCGAKLEALNPNGVLERGYAYVSVANAHIASAVDLKIGMKARIHFKDGQTDVNVIKSTVMEQ